MIALKVLRSVDYLFTLTECQAISRCFSCFPIVLQFFEARSPGHHEEWILACKEGKQAMSNFAYAAPLTTMILLGNVAIRAGHKIEWDAKNRKVTTKCDLVNWLITPQYRLGYTL